MILPPVQSPVRSGIRSPIAGVRGARFSFLDNLPDAAVYSRASIGWEFNRAGLLVPYASGIARQGFDPITHAPFGTLLEQAAENTVRNSVAGGAVVGTPGTLPTNWAEQLVNCTREVVATGTDANGIPFVRLRVSGTPNANNGIQFVFDNSITNAAAAQNDVWAASVYVRLHAGSTTNLGLNTVYIFAYDNASGFLTSAGTNFTMDANPLASNRKHTVQTLANASTAYARMIIDWRVTSGNAVDFTVDIGLPQLEKNNEPTSPILTTGSKITRAEDSCHIPVARLGYNPLASTLYMKGKIPYANRGNAGTIMNLDGGSNNERITTYYEQANNRIYGTMFAGGVQQTNLTNAGVMGSGNVFKVAHACEANNANIAFNGTLGTSDTSCTMPAAADKLWLGRRFGGLGHAVYVQDVGYYGRRLSNSEAQVLSTL